MTQISWQCFPLKFPILHCSPIDAWNFEIFDNFYGWNISNFTFDTTGFECDGCSNICEIVEIRKNNNLIARWGSRCGKWDDLKLISEDLIIRERPLEKNSTLDPIIKQI